MTRSHLPALGCTLLLLTGCSSIHDDLSRQILQPPTGWLAEPADFGLEAETLEIAVGSGASLTGWWIPSAAANGRTVVLLHEESTNASALHPYYTFLHDAGFHVLAFDPRGFGRSRGQPTLRAWLHDVSEVFDWLERHKGIGRDNIALYGTSMGSVAAVWAARMHRPRAVVLEHLPSIREMLREAMNGDGSAMSAYQLGFVEFGLPENLEPVDNAPRTMANALFIATEHEAERDRRALLRTFEAYAGPKSLWVLPATGRAPHALLTLDQDYRAAVTDFLTRALANERPAVAAGVRKVRDASNGEAWYEVELDLARGSDSAPWAVEACVLLDNNTPYYGRAWIDAGSGTVRMRLPTAPTHVTGRRVFAAAAGDDVAYEPTRSHLQRSGEAVAALWPQIEELRNEVMPRRRCLEFAATMAAATATEPFHPTLEAELADVFARIGLQLAADEATQADATAWLDRAIAAVPARPELHFWPGPVPTYGFPYQDVIDRAERRRAALRR